MEVPHTFHYLGPNRRSDDTCIEQHYLPDETELAAFKIALPGLKPTLENRLAGMGIQANLSGLDDLETKDEREAFANALCTLGLALQQAGGHRVTEYGWLVDDFEGGIWAWFEYEHHLLALPAAILSLRLISEAMQGDGLDIPEFPDFDWAGDYLESELETAVARFLDTARPLVLPKITEAIIEAAKRLNIPCNKLERLPFEDTGGEIRVLKNGLLVLGHGPYLEEVDGTVATWQSSHLLQVIQQRRAQQQQFGQQSVAGTKHELVVAGEKVLGLVIDGVEQPVESIHPDTITAAEQLAKKAKAGLLVLEILCQDISQPLEQTGGSVSDINLVPELDQILPEGSPIIAEACEAFLRWVYPDQDKTRIPVVAVTGTNGKTTTCRMVEHIARVAGRKPGMSCTEGVYIGTEHIGGYSEMGGAAFHHLMTREDVDYAVCEEWLGRICRVGFAYLNSTVAVCTNVTNDHLGRVGLHTIDQLAAMKESVPQRGREAAVLNAENEYTLAMAPRMQAKKVCLVSTRGKSAIPDPDQTSHNATCTVEDRDGRDWIVICDGEEEYPIVAVEEIPATFDGAAVFNVSNALHAAAAAYYSGLPIDSIGEGLRSFRMSFETTPGRLNFVNGLPYSVLMDYAHNPDGFDQILSFLENVEVEGERRLLLAYTGDRKEEDVIEGAQKMAPHFDHFVCRNYLKGRGQAPEVIPAQLKKGLLSAGISEDAITVIEDAYEAVDFILDSAKPGDLVLILPGTSEFGVIWKNLQERVAAHGATIH